MKHLKPNEKGVEQAKNALGLNDFGADRHDRLTQLERFIDRHGDVRSTVVQILRLMKEENFHENRDRDRPKQGD